MSDAEMSIARVALRRKADRERVGREHRAGSANGATDSRWFGSEQ